MSAAAAVSPPPWDAARVRRALLAAVAAWVLAVPSPAAPVPHGPDPTRPLTELGLDTWSTSEGLPNATVNAILESREGYIWLATYEGLARFDGSSFTLFGSAEGLAGNGVRTLCEDPAGGLWIGTNGGGLSRFSKGRFTRFGTAEGLPSDLVWALHTDRRDGSLWIGMNGGGLAHLKDGCIERYPLELSGRTVSAIAQAADGSLWLCAHEEGLRKLSPDGQRFTAYGPADGVPPGALLCLVSGRGGTLLGATGRGGVFRIVEDRIVAAPAGLEPIAGTAISAVLEDEGGTLWLGTNGQGLARLAGGKLAYLRASDGVGDVVWALRLDRGGQLWVGTNGAGVSRLRDGGFTSLTTRQGLAHEFAYTTFQDRSGSIWAGTVGGLDRLEGDRFVPVPFPAGKPAMVRSIAEGDDGSLWVATQGSGVWRLSRGRWRGYDQHDGLASNRVRAVLVDGSGAVWAATGDGLCRLEGERWKAYGIQDGLPHASAIGLAEDPQGGLWVGTDGGGLARLLDGRFESFTVGDGLASNVVLALFVDSRGQLWVGTNGGLSRRAGSRFVSFTRSSGLPSDTVTQICEDADGALWVGTSRGVSRLSFPPGDTAPGTVAVETFDRQDGMRSSECTAPGQPAGLRSRDGRLWFATTRGLSFVDPRRLRTDPGPPTMVIEKVLVNGASLPFEDGVQVPAGPARVEIRFAALSPRGPRRTVARFRLEGFDPGWADAGGTGRVDYTGLPPGSYLFRLVGRSRNGSVESAAVALPLRVAPRFYQTSGFALLVGLAVVAAALAGHRLRVRVLEARERALRALVDEKTRSLAVSERRFRQLAENIDAVFFVRSVDPPQVLYLSPAFERVWGRPLVTDPVEFLETVHPDDRPALGAVFARQQEGYDIEYRIRRPDGAIRWIRSRSFPVGDAAGRVERVAGIAEDVTLRKSVEQLRDDLTHTLVHDLRGPLISIHASMEYLEEELRSGPAAARELVDAARNGALRLLSMVNAILDVSQLEQGAMPIELEAVDLAALAGEVLRLLRPLAAARKVVLALDVPGDAPRVRADRGLLGRVLENLLGNAIRFSPPGGRIDLRARPVEGTPRAVRVEVVDEGPGIPDEVRGRLFEKFATRGGKARGTGLGLLFCRLAVEAHGGRISGENGPSGGASFSFTVPQERGGDRPA